MDDFGFLDLVWTLLIAYGLVLALIVLFWVVRDLLHDRTLPGYAKAIWLFFLITLPLAAALVYLLARGQGMGERADARRAAEAQAFAALARESGDDGVAREIARGKELLDEGTITGDEFDALKERALA